MYAGRLTYNFLNAEKNPGYYTSNTYYGTAGDILALEVGFNHQQNGAGSLAAPGNLTVLSATSCLKNHPRTTGACLRSLVSSNSTLQITTRPSPLVELREAASVCLTGCHTRGPSCF